MRVVTMAMAVLLPLLLSPAVTAQQADPTAERAPLARGYRTRALAGGWGHCLKKIFHIEDMP